MGTDSRTQDIVVRETEETETSTSSLPGVPIDGDGTPLSSNALVATLDSILDSREEEWNIFDVINGDDPDSEEYLLTSLRKRLGLVRVDGEILTDVELLKLVTLTWLNHDTETQMLKLEEKFLRRFGLNITPCFDESCCL